MLLQKILKSGYSGILALVAVVSATPVLADNTNFGSLSLSPGFTSAKAVVRGYTNGSVSLSSIQNNDIHNNACIGYGSATPDHVIVLDKNFSRLTVQVDSGNKDTTILIKGPDGIVRCGDDTGTSKDASVQDSNWKAGKYSIWVGAIDSGKRWDYTLSVKQ